MASSFEMSEIRRAVKDLAGAGGKLKSEVCKTAAKNFVRDVVAITPPASKGETGAAAKRQGEKSIQIDLSRLFRAVVLKGARPEQHPDLESLHRRHRNARGRINGKPRYPVDAAKLETLKKLLLSRVGLLAAGWNSAAEKLGVSLPAWVRRHGTAFSVAKITVTKNTFRIEMTNAVPFVGSVADYERRIEKAILYQMGKMDRQSDFLMKKALRAAGWK